MGCHTWFSRPITETEFELMKEYAPIEIYKLNGDTPFNIKYGIYDKHLYTLLMKSYAEDLPCVYGKYWWQLGYGGSNPNLLNGEDNLFYEVKGDKRLFVDIREYADLFRVYHYPSKVIHSRKELRRWMRKKYFELENWQLEEVSRFFRENPGGVITFG